MNEYSAPDRFSVSHQGMRALHINREPWQLVKELVQNVWDEAPEATVCRVTISPHPAEDAVQISVEDDGPGFHDLDDAWTLLKHTPKRYDPVRRGRFNMGEKELISVALEAAVETVGHTVTFPRLGSRDVRANTRRRGTLVTALMPWRRDAAGELEERLTRFRPTDCRLVVNGKEVPRREPVAVRRATLRTVIQNPDDDRLRETRRRTEIHILEPATAGEYWLYEMGIPIQPITTSWDLDILQKVPMPPNRDTVSEAYLTDVYAEVLNETHAMMEQEEFGEQWVKQAVEDPRTSNAAIRATVQGRYGDRALLTSNDADANLRAVEEGYELINPRSLSRIERDRFRADAGLLTTHQALGREYSAALPCDPRDLPGSREFTAWVKEQAAYCDLQATVSFINDPQARILAQCSANTRYPEVSFNVARLGKEFFQPPYGRTEHLELLFHELGHALANTPMEHGPRWGEGVARAGALIARGNMGQLSASAVPKPASAGERADSS